MTAVGIATVFAFMAVFFGVYGLFAPSKPAPKANRDEFFSRDLQDLNETFTDTGESSDSFERFVRPMLRNFLPQSPLSASLSQTQQSKIAELLVQSGNPWNIRPEEYRGSQLLFAFIGFILGSIIGILGLIPGPFFLPMLLLPLMGWVYPFSAHNTAREKRQKEVLREFPGALDLLSVATTGKNFEPALVETANEMPDTFLKVEFERMIQELRAGRGLETVLNGFARRTATDDTEAFVKSVIQSQRLGVAIGETLQSQARAARRNYEARLEKKIMKLSSRMFIFLIPTMIPSLMLIVGAPAIYQLLQYGF